MYIVVCDDEQIHLSFVVKELTKLTALRGAQIQAFNSPSQMWAHLGDTDAVPDITVLDIRMQESGIDVAQEINTQYPYCQIIFLTSFIEYAPNVYDVKHTYFILKAELAARLPGAVKKAMDSLRATSERYFILSVGTKHVVAPVSEIAYLERMGRRTRVVTLVDEHLTYQTPAELMHSKNNTFVRCHMSFYANALCVRMIEKGYIVMSNSHRVPLSRTYRGAREQILTIIAQSFG